MILLSIISLKLLHLYINKVLYFKNLTQFSGRKWINLSSLADFLMCIEEKKRFLGLSNSLKWAVSDGHCCVILPGHSLRAAVRLLVWRPLWCVVSRHHSHRAGRRRSPAGWDASSQSTLQDPPVSPLEGAPTTQLEAAHTQGYWNTAFHYVREDNGKLNLTVEKVKGKQSQRLSLQID